MYDNMIRKSCSNVATMTYSGKELSPLGNGISAEGFELDTILKGCDKMNWIVKNKNNRKVWIRLNTNVEKMVHGIQKDEQQADDDKEQKDKIETKNNNEDNPINKDNPNKKKVTYYIKFMTKRNNEIKMEGNTMSGKEINSKIRQEWKELKENKEKYDEVISTL